MSAGGARRAGWLDEETSAAAATTPLIRAWLAHEKRFGLAEEKLRDALATARGGAAARLAGRAEAAREVRAASRQALRREAIQGRRAMVRELLAATARRMSARVGEWLRVAEPLLGEAARWLASTAGAVEEAERQAATYEAEVAAADRVASTARRQRGDLTARVDRLDRLVRPGVDLLADDPAAEDSPPVVRAARLVAGARAAVSESIVGARALTTPVEGQDPVLHDSWRSDAEAALAAGDAAKRLAQSALAELGAAVDELSAAEALVAAVSVDEAIGQCRVQLEAMRQVVAKAEADALEQGDLATAGKRLGKKLEAVLVHGERLDESLAAAVGDLETFVELEATLGEALAGVGPAGGRPRAPEVPAGGGEERAKEELAVRVARATLGVEAMDRRALAEQLRQSVLERSAFLAVRHPDYLEACESLRAEVRGLRSRAAADAERTRSSAELFAGIEPAPDPFEASTWAAAAGAAAEPAMSPNEWTVEWVVATPSGKRRREAAELERAGLAAALGLPAERTVASLTWLAVQQPLLEGRTWFSLARTADGFVRLAADGLILLTAAAGGGLRGDDGRPVWWAEPGGPKRLDERVWWLARPRPAVLLDASRSFERWRTEEGWITDWGIRAADFVERQLPPPAACSPELGDLPPTRYGFDFERRVAAGPPGAVEIAVLRNGAEERHLVQIGDEVARLPKGCWLVAVRPGAEAACTLFSRPGLRGQVDDVRHAVRLELSCAELEATAGFLYRSFVKSGRHGAIPLPDGTLERYPTSEYRLADLTMPGYDPERPPGLAAWLHHLAEKEELYREVVRRFPHQQAERRAEHEAALARRNDMEGMAAKHEYELENALEAHEKLYRHARAGLAVLAAPAPASLRAVARPGPGLLDRDWVLRSVDGPGAGSLLATTFAPEPRLLLGDRAMPTSSFRLFADDPEPLVAALARLPVGGEETVTAIRLQSTWSQWFLSHAAAAARFRPGPEGRIEDVELARDRLAGLDRIEVPVDLEKLELEIELRRPAGFAKRDTIAVWQRPAGAPLPERAARRVDAWRLELTEDAVELVVHDTTDAASHRLLRLSAARPASAAGLAIRARWSAAGGAEDQPPQHPVELEVRPLDGPAGAPPDPRAPKAFPKTRARWADPRGGELDLGPRKRGPSFRLKAFRWYATPSPAGGGVAQRHCLVDLDPRPDGRLLRDLSGRHRHAVLSAEATPLAPAEPTPDTLLGATLRRPTAESVTWELWAGTGRDRRHLCLDGDGGLRWVPRAERDETTPLAVLEPFAFSRGALGEPWGAAADDQARRGRSGEDVLEPYAQVVAAGAPADEGERAERGLPARVTEADRLDGEEWVDALTAAWQRRGSHLEPADPRRARIELDAVGLDGHGWKATASPAELAEALSRLFDDLLALPAGDAGRLARRRLAAYGQRWTVPGATWGHTRGELAELERHARSLLTDLQAERKTVAAIDKRFSERLARLGLQRVGDRWETKLFELGGRLAEIAWPPRRTTVSKVLPRLASVGIRRTAKGASGAHTWRGRRAERQALAACADQLQAELAAVPAAGDPFYERLLGLGLRLVDDRWRLKLGELASELLKVIAADARADGDDRLRRRRLARRLAKLGVRRTAGFRPDASVVALWLAAIRRAAAELTPRRPSAESRWIALGHLDALAAERTALGALLPHVDKGWMSRAMSLAADAGSIDMRTLKRPERVLRRELHGWGSTDERRRPALAVSPGGGARLAWEISPVAGCPLRLQVMVELRGPAPAERPDPWAAGIAVLELVPGVDLALRRSPETDERPGRWEWRLEGGRVLPGTATVVEDRTRGVGGNPQRLGLRAALGADAGTRRPPRPIDGEPAGGGDPAPLEVVVGEVRLAVRPPQPETVATGGVIGLRPPAAPADDAAAYLTRSLLPLDEGAGPVASDASGFGGQARLDRCRWVGVRAEMEEEE